MAQASVSFDALLQQSREKRKAEQLAQEIFGRNRRQRAQNNVKPAAVASLASRMGVNKRTSSLPRSNTAPPRNGRRTPPAQLGRPSLLDKSRTKSSLAVPNIQASDDLMANRSYAAAAYNGQEISIRGAAGGPHVVVAQNFAPGTTAADIESVMIDVGGQLNECRLIATSPTVVAEMTFVERAGAEAVIATFNNKKADGRTLYVYMKSPNSTTVSAPIQRQPVAAQPDIMAAEDGMEVDSNAEARREEDRLREERRGRAGRGGRENLPTGPRAEQGYEDDYYRGPRRAEPAYQDGRYGFGGEGNRYDGRGRFPNDGRLRSDEVRRGGGQGWRR